MDFSNNMRTYNVIEHWQLERTEADKTQETLPKEVMDNVVAK